MPERRLRNGQGTKTQQPRTEETESTQEKTFGRTVDNRGPQFQEALSGGDADMTDEPVYLDEHRGMAAQKETELRRLMQDVQADQAALRVRQEQLESVMLTADATTWPEAAAKARYLIELYATTAEARDPRRQQLIERVLADLARLAE